MVISLNWSGGQKAHPIRHCNVAWGADIHTQLLIVLHQQIHGALSKYGAALNKDVDPHKSLLFIVRYLPFYSWSICISLSIYLLTTQSLATVPVPVRDTTAVEKGTWSICAYRCKDDELASTKRCNETSSFGPQRPGKDSPKDISGKFFSQRDFLQWYQGRPSGKRLQGFACRHPRRYRESGYQSAARHWTDPRVSRG